MKVEIISHTSNPEKLIAASAKLCYSKSDVSTLLDNLTPEKVKSFIDTLASLGHESPLEHVTFTFAIEGVSRALLTQITRHRIASFSVQSQRYVSKHNFEYIIPDTIKNNAEALKIFEDTMQMLSENYDRLSEIIKKDKIKEFIEKDLVNDKDANQKASKIANEDARYILPNACDTRIIMTMNIRSLYNFFKLRCCNRAQWEIRNLAWEMLRQCKQISPKLFLNAGPSCIRDKCPEGKMTCGKQYEIREKAEKL